LGYGRGLRGVLVAASFAVGAVSLLLMRFSRGKAEPG